MGGIPSMSGGSGAGSVRASCRNMWILVRDPILGSSEVTPEAVRSQATWQVWRLLPKPVVLIS